MALTVFGFMRDEVRVRPGKYRYAEGDDVIVVAHLEEE
jgi:hypothetical protein